MDVLSCPTKIEFQTTDVSISKGNKKYPIGTSFFTRIFAFRVFIAFANTLSSKYYFYFLTNYFYHKQAKFEQNRMIRTTQKFDLFDKKKNDIVLITSDISLAPF